MADYSTAARPYAKALFELARDNGNFADWSARLEFWAAVVTNPEMRQRLEQPGVSPSDRARMLETVAAHGMDDPSRNFIRLLAENNRLSIMPDVAGIFEELRADAEGEIEAEVASAYELDDNQRDRIADALSKRLNRRVRLVTHIDDSLVGGAVVRAGDLVIDGSVRGQLAKMERQVTS